MNTSALADAMNVRNDMTKAQIEELEKKVNTTNLRAMADRADNRDNAQVGLSLRSNVARLRANQFRALPGSQSVIVHTANSVPSQV